MKLLLRKLALSAAAVLVILYFSPASAQSGQATVNASIKKPLVMTRKTDMSFGTILLSGTGTFSSTVSISQTGVLTCPATYFTCSGATSAAVYNASGNRGPVTISGGGPVTLTNANGETLTLTVNAPSSVMLTNSGNPGSDFGVGGSLTLTNNTPDGVYSGTMNVTANYP